jgi:HK97 family phage prohead protease
VNNRWEFATRTEVSPEGTLSGYAAVFGVPTSKQDQFPGTETIARGAFTEALKAPGNIRATVDHGSGTIGLLGTTDAGTLRLSQDDVGLRFEIDAPDTTTARDLRVLVARGDVQGASFMAKMNRATIERTAAGVVHHDFPELIDICITAMPAYAETSVAARTGAEQTLRAQLASIRARVMMRGSK